MTKAEAADAQARCDSPSGPIYTMDTRAALADRERLIEALKPLITQSLFTPGLQSAGENAYALLTEMGELE